MSDSTEPDADAWAKACAEDLAAERARRQQRYGSQTGSAADEFGRLVDSVAQKIAEFTTPLAGAAGETAGRRAAESAAEKWTRQVADGAKAVFGPVAERNPKVLEHLVAAGSELVSAYQAAVAGQEQRWTRGDAGGVGVTRVEGEAPQPAPSADQEDGAREPEGGGAPEGRKRSATEEEGRRGGEAGRREAGRGDEEPPSSERIDLE